MEICVPFIDLSHSHQSQAFRGLFQIQASVGRLLSFNKNGGSGFCKFFTGKCSGLYECSVCHVLATDL